MTNSYIDKLPLFIIQKVKQKFDASCNNKFELSQQQFSSMYSPYMRSQFLLIINQQINVIRLSQILTKLFQYYTDFRKVKLNFKQFIAKYAILNKCQEQILSNIIHFIYSKTDKLQKQRYLTKQQYTKITQVQRKYFCFQPTQCSEEYIGQQKFYQLLSQAGFLWQDYRKIFSLIDKADLPFQSITRGLMQMDVHDYQQDKNYYLISSAWFERWSYYYQGATQDENNNKSTKIIKRRTHIESARKKGLVQRSSFNRKDMSAEDNAWVIQRPSQITFEDIEGEFKLQLKQNIRANYQIKIITQQIWQLFKKTLNAAGQFRRLAISGSSLDLYPKSIYFFETDENGKIVDSTFKLILMSLKKKLKDLGSQNSNKAGNQITYFIKNFDDNIWGQEKSQSALGMCSAQPRFIVVKTSNRSKFLQNYSRKKKLISNLTYGDKIYSYFMFNKRVMQAYIMRFPSETKVLIHYIGYNFRYQIEVDISNISVDEQPLSQSVKNHSGKKMLENDTFSFKGLQNIGNTCFINSIIQCLIASPILQNFFTAKKCKPSKQPMLTQICQIANSLLSNRKISPVQLKKTIDMQLQIFSGNDQHDAQQFLSLLIEELNKQIKKIDKTQETVLEFLFKGQVESTLQCLQCQNTKKNQQQLSIVSLPIPQTEYITFSLILFPIYDKKIRKIVMRIHRESKFRDYIKQFQSRVGKDALNFIFVQAHYGNLKKIRHDFLDLKNRDMSLSEINLSSSMEIYCYQRYINAEFMDILQQNKKTFKKQIQYFDYQDEQTQKWYFGKFQNGTNKSKIQIVNQDNTFSIIKAKEDINQFIKPLGSKTKQLIYKKLITRRYNSVLQKMQVFGIHYMVGYPKQVTFKQLQNLVDICMQNFLIDEDKKSYYIKICESTKQKCLYCNQVQSKMKNQQQRNCCKLTDVEKNIPLMWIAREKNYSIFVDWTDVDNFNTAFGAVQMDQLSIKAQKMKQNDKIQIEDCLKLYQQPQNVEMECQKCKHKQQKRTQIMKYVPNILILHMKQYRMGPDMNLIKMQANLKWIQFLDISNYSVAQKGTIYELYAYVTHIGTSQSGHYTCAVKRKHPFENKKVWVSFDDQTTSIMDKQQKNIDSAYLLFFKRIDMPNSAYVNFTNF